MYAGGVPASSSVPSVYFNTLLYLYDIPERCVGLSTALASAGTEAAADVDAVATAVTVAMVARVAAANVAETDMRR